MARKNPKTLDAARPLSCVLYIRVSTKLQVEKGESIDAQRFEPDQDTPKITTCACSESTLTPAFQERTCKAGPQFRQMMDDIIKAQPSKRPAYVLVFKLSRFGATPPTRGTPFRRSKTTAWTVLREGWNRLWHFHG